MTPPSSPAVTVIDDDITICADALADNLGLTVEALRDAMARGLVTGVAEAGTGENAGTLRLTFRYRAATWRFVVDVGGRFRDVTAPADSPDLGQPGRNGLAGRLGKRS